MQGKLKFLDKWYEDIKALARHRLAMPWLAFIAFIESSIFPLPVDLMVIPMVQADHKRWWKIALVASIFSVLGGIAGYFMGLWFFDLLAQPVLEKLGKAEKMASFSAKIEQYGGMAVFGAGLTPFPYKVITIMSGALKINFGVFVAASVIARFMRFFAVAGIVRLFGQQAEEIMKKHFALFTTGVFLLCIAGWFAYKSLAH
jgi:membrane protein YqaA with SNARE-associated domain